MIDLKKCLLAEKQRKRISLHPTLLRKQGEGPPRPTIRCKEKAKVEGIHASEEGNMYIDDDAEWTYGSVRPLYRVSEARCLSCPSGGKICAS